MRTGRGMATAGAIAIAIAVTETALAAEPTFVNGLSQAVFAQGQANWVNHELWVETRMDSDGDGRRDRVHVDVSRPTETETDGLDVPVIYEDSPYYADGADITNWAVDHEIGQPPTTRSRAPYFAARNTSPVISTRHENAWVPRGFAVVHSESPGTGHSDGCPNSGAPIETEGAVAVIDWLNGRAKGYATRTGDDEVTAHWTTGKVGMIGTSYNGTLPIAAASKGVDGLEAIVPISAISDWYDYYRANGMVRAPGGFQGEDLDVLTEYIYSRADELGQRTKCWPTIAKIAAEQDRTTGDRSAFWQHRNYMKDAENLRAATLLAHGNNDFNVMTKHAAQLYEALKAQDVPHQFFFHQGGHGGAPPDVLVNHWFTRYLWGHQNRVESHPRSWVVRSEPGACPPRQSTVGGDHSSTATLTVADASPFRLGFTLTVPQTNADGTVSTTTRVITNVAGTTLALASPVATAAGQRVADGATVSLVCGNANPTPYPEWPDPATGDVTLRPTAGGGARGGLGLAAGSGTETLEDDATVTAASLMNAPSENSRLLYVTSPLERPVRISGTPRVNLTAAFSKAKANLTAHLVSLPQTGNGTILTRGWIDPENRSSDWASVRVTPGRFYRLRFDLQAKDVVVPAGRRLGLMVLSSDHDFTVRPAPGTQVTVDLARSSFTLPVVGGAQALEPARR